MKIKTYKELIRLPTFKERYDYLKVTGYVGESTFGYDRYLNQEFYRSYEWLAVRSYVIIRDNGCDLGMEGYDIHTKIFIHHITPITPDDIVYRTDRLLSPDNLICTSHRTHQAIHFGDSDLLPKDPIIRKQNDTCPWKQ